MDTHRDAFQAGKHSGRAKAGSGSNPYRRAAELSDSWEAGYDQGTRRRDDKIEKTIRKALRGRSDYNDRKRSAFADGYRAAAANMPPVSSWQAAELPAYLDGYYLGSTRYMVTIGYQFELSKLAASIGYVWDNETRRRSGPSDNKHSTLYVKFSNQPGLKKAPAGWPKTWEELEAGAEEELRSDPIRGMIAPILEKIFRHGFRSFYSPIVADHVCPHEDESQRRAWRIGFNAAAMRQGQPWRRILRNEMQPPNPDIQVRPEPALSMRSSYDPSANKIHFEIRDKATGEWRKVNGAEPSTKAAMSPKAFDDLINYKWDDPISKAPPIDPFEKKPGAPFEHPEADPPSSLEELERRKAAAFPSSGAGFLRFELGPEEIEKLSDSALNEIVVKLGRGRTPEPIPMVLHCPTCGAQHIDAPEPGTGWKNPPHRSHKCAKCLEVWRPADVPTTGVERIETSGAADTFAGSDRSLVKARAIFALCPDGIWRMVMCYPVHPESCELFDKLEAEEKRYSDRAPMVALSHVRPLGAARIELARADRPAPSAPIYPLGHSGGSFMDWATLQSSGDLPKSEAPPAGSESRPYVEGGPNAYPPSVGELDNPATFKQVSELLNLPGNVPLEPNPAPPTIAGDGPERSIDNDAQVHTFEDSPGAEPGTVMRHLVSSEPAGGTVAIGGGEPEAIVSIRLDSSQNAEAMARMIESVQNKPPYTITNINEGIEDVPGRRWRRLTCRNCGSKAEIENDVIEHDSRVERFRSRHGANCPRAERPAKLSEPGDLPLKAAAFLECAVAPPSPRPTSPDELEAIGAVSRDQASSAHVPLIYKQDEKAWRDGFGAGFYAFYRNDAEAYLRRIRSPEKSGFRNGWKKAAELFAERGAWYESN